jgi:hypothetical protein
VCGVRLTVADCHVEVFETERGKLPEQLTRANNPVGALLRAIRCDLSRFGWSKQEPPIGFEVVRFVNARYNQ